MLLGVKSPDFLLRCFLFHASGTEEAGFYNARSVP